ncbi:MAG: hypothetical protein OXF26_04155 [Alphaproteobacteria bacterium]|nr:hypothetical protein [Alphaproteobacteria bacterium]MCY4318495.1 hypothetical protein [Alphaproteobacteria bacterium]
MASAYPPGATDGPIVELPALDALSVESAPRWRAYLASQSLNWLPGKTRRPAAKGAPFGWSHNPADYPVLTREDRRRLAFGEADTKHRTKSEIDDAFRDLPSLVTLEQEIDPRTGEIGFRIMPAEATPDRDQTP